MDRTLGIPFFKCIIVIVSGILLCVISLLMCFRTSNLQFKKRLYSNFSTAYCLLDSMVSGVAEQEEELKRLRQEVEGFPKTLEKEVEKAKRETEKAMRLEAERNAELFQREREWERRIFEQKIQFLEETVEGLQAKIKDLQKESAHSMEQVAQIAEKAIEGASQFRAFSSVKDIALEQARSPGQKKEGAKS